MNKHIILLCLCLVACGEENQASDSGIQDYSLEEDAFTERDLFLLDFNPILDDIDLGIVEVPKFNEGF